MGSPDGVHPWSTAIPGRTIRFAILFSAVLVIGSLYGLLSMLLPI